MSAKLYKYEKNRITEDIEFEELSVEEFDALESEHVFSEAYQEKKNHLLNSYRQREDRHPYRKRVQVALIALTVLFISGTVAAVSSNYLRQVYENMYSQIDPKYWLTDFTNSNYELPVTVETNDTEDLLDLQVLQAMKGQHTIALAILVTAKDLNLVPKRDYTTLGNLGFDIRVDGKSPSSLSGRRWFYRGTELGLSDNQFVEFCEITFSRTLDLTKVDSFDFELSVPHYVEGDEMIPDNLWTTDELWDGKKWTLHIPINGNYNEYVYEIDRQYDISDYSISIKEIQLTPSHVTLYYEPLVGKKRMGTTSAIMINPEKNKLLMADGSKITFEQISTSWDAHLYQPVREETIHFNIPLDPDQIVGLEFDGVEVLFK